MSVWTTSTAGLDTVLATIGQTVNNNSIQQTQSAQQHQPGLIHQTSLPQLHSSTTKSHSALHLNSLSINGAGGFSHGSTGSGSSPNHSTHTPHHQNYHSNHNNSINQYHPTHYHSSSHLFTPQTPSHTHNSFIWSKPGGTVYQQKVSTQHKIN